MSLSAFFLLSNDLCQYVFTDLGSYLCVYVKFSYTTGRITFGNVESVEDMSFFNPGGIPINMGFIIVEYGFSGVLYCDTIFLF